MSRTGAGRADDAHPKTPAAALTPGFLPGTLDDGFAGAATHEEGAIGHDAAA